MGIQGTLHHEKFVRYTIENESKNRVPRENEI